MQSLKGKYKWTFLLNVRVIFLFFFFYLNCNIYLIIKKIQLYFSSGVWYVSWKTLKHFKHIFLLVKLGSTGQLVRFGNTAPPQITQTHDFQNCMINNYFPILLASLAYKNLARLFRLECQVAFHLVVPSIKLRVFLVFYRIFILKNRGVSLEIAAIAVSIAAHKSLALHLCHWICFCVNKTDQNVYVVLYYHVFLMTALIKTFLTYCQVYFPMFLLYIPHKHPIALTYG